MSVTVFAEQNIEIHFFLYERVLSQEGRRIFTHCHLYL